MCLAEYSEGRRAGLCCVINGEFVDQLRDCHVLKMDFALWSSIRDVDLNMEHSF